MSRQPLSPGEFYTSLFLAREGVEQTLDVSISEPDSEFAESFRDQLTKTIELHERGHLLSRDFQILRMKMFVKHLVDIQFNSSNLISDFQNMIDEMGYYGLRCEIDVCASLLRKKYFL